MDTFGQNNKPVGKYEDVPGLASATVRGPRHCIEHRPDGTVLHGQKAIRMFDSGATRNGDDNKLDYEGFLSPLVLRRFAEYMHKHRHQADGTVRASDNWQRGIPIDAYMKSGFRHFMDWWLHHREHQNEASESLEDALCALIFNAQGYLHERLKGQDK